MHKFAVRVIPALGMMWVAAAHAQLPTQPMSTTVNTGQGPAGNYLPVEQSGVIGNYTPRSGPHTIVVNPGVTAPTCFNNCDLFIGTGAGASYADGDYGAVGIGFQALHNLLGGPDLPGNSLLSETVAVGSAAGYSLTTGKHNIAIGTHALGLATTASFDIAIGPDALAFSNAGTQGNGNIAIGDAVLKSDQGPGGNVVIGAGDMKLSSLQDPASGNFTIVGQNSFTGTASLTTAEEIVAVGDNIAKTTMTTAKHDVFMGSNSGNAVTSDSFSTMLGDSTGKVTNGTTYNTFVGANAGRGVTTGSKNTVIGGQEAAVAVSALTTGTNNILIGYDINAIGAANNNQIDIADLVFYNFNSTAAPSVFTGCGTSPSIDANANNKSGTFTMGTGGVTSCAITFAGSGYRAWNHCRVTPHSVSTAFGYSYTTTALTVTGTNISSVVVDYDCDGQ